MTEERLPSFIEFILMSNNYGIDKEDAIRLVNNINEEERFYVDYLINHVMKCLEKTIVDESINTTEFSEMYNKIGELSHLHPSDDIVPKILEIKDFLICKYSDIELNMIYQVILDIVEIQAVIYNMFNKCEVISDFFAAKKILHGQIIDVDKSFKLERYINENYGVYKQ